MFSTWLYVRFLFVHCQTCQQGNLKMNEPIFCKWQKWSMGQGRETMNFEGQDVKDQGHMMPQLDFEAWQRRQSRPIRSSRFSGLPCKSTE